MTETAEPPVPAPTPEDTPEQPAPTPVDEHRHDPPAESVTIDLGDESYAEQIHTAWAREGDAVVGSKTDQRAGRDIVYNVGAPLSVRVVDDYVRFTTGDLDRWLSAFAPPEDQGELERLLGERPVVVVRGEPGTGRTAAALAAIRTRFGAAGRISGRIAPARIDVTRLDDGCGYVLDATYASWAHTLEAADISSLSAKLAGQDCTIAVLIGPGTRTDPRADAYTVTHLPPRPWDVVRGHLRAASPGRSEDELAAIEKRFGAARLPERMRILARAAQCYGERGEFTLDAGAIEEAARGCLIKPPEMSREDWAGCRSFLIAWAILDGLPAAKICHASLEIAEEVQRVERPGRLRDERSGSGGAVRAGDVVERGSGERPGLARSPLVERFDRWFSYVAEVDGTGPPSEAPLLRLLTFATPGFGSTLLRMLWRDHPVVRTPLLQWMRDHVRNEPTEVRDAIAKALGVFTAQDFAFVKLHRLNLWAADRSSAMHGVVADAMGEAARLEPAVRAETVAVVEKWISDGSAPHVSTATLALGTEIGAGDPDWALRMLRRVATGKVAKLEPAVARSLRRLFVSGARRQVVAALTDWNRSAESRLRGIAADAVRDIAKRREPGEPGTPAMLAFCRDERGAALAVAHLWNAVLTGHYVNKEHWRALRRWCGMTPRPPEVSELIARLDEFDTLRPRLRYKLGLVL